MWLTILKDAAGPVIGAVIGYFTNLIAVKMLFYPKKAVKVFGHTLPFTPGVIPKGKPRLARAIGKAVGETLITKEDLENRLLSESMMNQMTDKIVESLSVSIKDVVIKATDLPESMYASGKEKLAGKLSDAVVQELKKIDFGALLVDKGSSVIRDSIKNPMIKMFVTEDLISSIAEPAGQKIKDMLETDGNSYVNAVISRKLDRLEDKSPVELLENAEVSEIMLKGIISSVMRKLIGSGLGKVIESVDIAGMVEAKINEMDIDQLEKLIIQVMKKELNTIVNLGALIGFVLGLINLLVQQI